jgi:pimeloyl-ACP methyl ester carboxylesterase
MMPAVKKLFVVLLVLAALIAAGWISGNEPELDAVAAAETELGIDLETSRVPVGEVSLFTVQAGPKDGRPVLLLHGFPEFWYAWYRQAGILAGEGFRAIAPDQRGYAGSDKPPHVDDYQVRKLADDAANLIAATGHESACVAAHDWGGGVAWALAIWHPERVRRLVIFDTPHPDASRSGPPKEETISWYRTAFQIPYFPEWLSRLLHWRILTRALVRTSAPGAFPDAKLALFRSAWDRDGSYGKMVNWYRAAFRSELYTGPVRRVAVPTLVVAAASDAFIPGDLTRRSVELLDSGRLLELDYGTHWVLQEEPEKTARIVADFCAEP